MSCKAVIELQGLDSDNVIVNEAFENWEAALFVARNQAFDVEELSMVEVGIVDSSATAHDTAPSLLPKSVIKLKDVALHDFGQGFH
jgi:hypothetical protein